MFVFVFVLCRCVRKEIWVGAEIQKEEGSNRHSPKPASRHSVLDILYMVRFLPVDD